MDLRTRTGSVFVDQVMRLGFLTEHRGRVQMSFDEPGTPSNLIIRLTRRDACAFKELKFKLPKRIGAKSANLKVLVSFLSNFKLIQFLTLPCSTETLIVADGCAQVEKDIDVIFEPSGLIESKILYRTDALDGADELRAL